jgi:SET and MYND domain-containing protein
MSAPKCFAEIKKSGIDGRGLFATKSLKAGELIFQKTRPLVAALDFIRQNDTCSNCFRSKLSELAVSSDASDNASFAAKKCTGCRMVSYCSKVHKSVITYKHSANVSQACQTQHWKRCHKHICKILKEALTNIPFLKENPHTISNVTFALVEMIETRRQLTLSERDWISLLQLKSHATEMKARDPGKFQEAEQIAERALIYLGNPPDYSQDFATQLACAILTNSLTLVAPTCDPLGLVLDPFACLANHSCEPNAYVVMDGPELSFRSLNAISAGEEVLVSYVDSTEAYRYRQAQLSRRYFFKCECMKCKKGPIFAQDQFLTPPADVQRKFKEHVEQMRLHDPKTIENMKMRFGLEGSKLSYTDLIDCYARNDLLVAGELELPQAKAQNHISRQEFLRRVLAQCQMSGQYKVTRQPYAAARNEYILECISEGDHTLAWRHAVRSYLDIDPVLFPESHNPIRVVHAHRLAKLTIFLADESEEKGQDLRIACIDLGLDMPAFAWKCMKEAAQQVDKSHGADSSFAHLVKISFKSAIEEAQSFAPDAINRIESSLAEMESKLRTICEALPY